MKLFSKLLVGSISGFIAISPLQVQETLAQGIERTPAEEVKAKKEFVELLEKTVYEKCVTTAPIADPNKRINSCKCYVDSYINRYTPESLLSMNLWSKNNPGKGSIILIMLQPERTKCNIPG